MKFKSVKSFVNSAALLFFLAGFVAAQNATNELKPTNCESNIAILAAAHQEAGNDGLIIMVARLGDNETLKELNVRRLHNAKIYLNQSVNRQSNTIVTAQGESAKGYGRIELYVNGKLFHALAVSKNLDLLVGACSFEGKKRCDFKHEKNFYPCLGKMPSAKQNVRKNTKLN